MKLAALSGIALLVAACPGDGAQVEPPPYTPFAVLDTTLVPPFDADSAHALLRRQVAFGPRVPGMPGHAAQLAWMTAFLRERADTLIVQDFTHETAGPSFGRGGERTTLRMTNLFARFNPTATTRILLLAHWDTRPTADMDSERDDEPIPGANDGASGTAVLLELANVLSRHSAPIGVDILLVDGEDYGPGSRDMYLGAKHFAATFNTYRPLYGILVDMVGDQQPEYPIEGNSQRYAPEVVERVWKTAELLGLGQYFPRTNGGEITDDHVPLNQAGIRTINIIDFDYGPGNRFWHTHEDSVENTSPLGLGVVGRVLATLIYTGG
ncbi:MAG TPA: M28 family peptidase [Longimicrobiales bacterium]|nr:M28 family peptidase [Longimicrobiales bacterium]